MTEKCPWCGKNLKNMRGLQTHVRQRHNIKEYRERGMSEIEIIAARRRANQLATEGRKAEKAAPESQKEHENPWVNAPKVVSPEDPEPEQVTKRPRKREKLWSETHPGGWDTVRSMLPRLHLVILALLLCYQVFMELLVGNLDFIDDWFRASWIGPALLEVTQSEYTFQLWWNEYGFEFIVIMSFIIMSIFMFYMLVWRVAFKTYIKYSEGEPKIEGRCYWRTNNCWTRLWDRLYRSPPRIGHTYWINQGKLFNIFNPQSCLTRLDTALDEKCEQKGLWRIWVHEKRIRRKVNNSSRHLTTRDYLFENGIIPIEYAESRFWGMTEKCVDDTTKLSYANPTTRNTVMTSGLRLTTPKLRQVIIDDRKQRQDNS